MSVITIEIPDDVREALNAAGMREHKSVEEIASESLARAVAAQKQLDYLRARSKQGRREHFESFLARVPDAPPLPGDEL